MTCPRCGAEMKPTIAYNLPSDDTLQMQAGLECLKCGMLYVNGEWVDMRAEPTEEDDEPTRS